MVKAIKVKAIILIIEFIKYQLSFSFHNNLKNYNFYIKFKFYLFYCLIVHYEWITKLGFPN